jgi:hypothetical protein
MAEAVEVDLARAVAVLPVDHGPVVLALLEAGVGQRAGEQDLQRLAVLAVLDRVDRADAVAAAAVAQVDVGAVDGDRARRVRASDCWSA